MFGAVEYIPHLPANVPGRERNRGGSAHDSPHGRLLVVSIITGRLVSARGKYKAYVVTGTALVALGLYLISTITPSTPTWIFCSYMAVMGAGLGMSMQFLTLIVQNASPSPS